MSTYSETMTATGTSSRFMISKTPARRMARSVESSRDSGQSSVSAWRITGSTVFWFSTTPERMARNHCASASR